MWYPNKSLAGGKGLWEEANISPAMAQSQRSWLRAFYSAPGPGAHSLTNLPATLTGFLATLVTGELNMQCGSSQRGQFLTGQLQRLGRQLPGAVQLAAACGMAVIRPIVSGGEFQFELLGPGRFFPTRFGADGTVLAGYIADFEELDGRTYVRLESFDCREDELHLSNRAYRTEGEVLMDQVPLKTVPRWDALAADITLTHVNKPLLGYMRMPFFNNVDPSSPLPVSIYAGAMESMAEFERVYGELLYELHSGKRKRIIERQAIAPEKAAERPGHSGLTGRGYRDISPDNYIVLDPMEQAKPFDDYSPQLRTEEYLTGLQVILRMVENQCHLSPGTLSLDARTGALTATEVISQDRTTYRTCAAIQEALSLALEDVIAAMDVLCSLYHLCPAGRISPALSFGDSVFEDTQAEFSRRMEMVKHGILRPEKLLEWYFDVDEATACGMREAPAATQEVTA